MPRKIVLDIETTGLDPFEGHRIVEIACVELVNNISSGQVYHTYLNPERPMPQEAFSIHGLSDDFLKNKPKFMDIFEDFLKFIGEAPLIIHNAKFDIKFLNYELEMHNQNIIPFSRAIDTLAIARQKFPGSPASLDALCKRFKIDNTSRTLHGALLDSELLALVYLELIGGKQQDFILEFQSQRNIYDHSAFLKKERVFRPPRSHQPSPEEEGAYQAFIKKLG